MLRILLQNMLVDVVDLTTTTVSTTKTKIFRIDTFILNVILKVIFRFEEKRNNILQISQHPMDRMCRCSQRNNNRTSTQSCQQKFTWRLILMRQRSEYSSTFGIELSDNMEKQSLRSWTLLVESIQSRFYRDMCGNWHCHV